LHIMQQKPTPGKAPIQSLDRGLELLLAVGAAGRQLSLNDLTRVLGVDRSSVHRLATTLKMKGFFVQDPRDKTYRLGPAILQLAGQLQQNDSLVQSAREVLQNLARRTRETAHLGVREGTTVVFLDHARGDQALSVASRCGEVAPLHCTAIGKALIADLALPQLEALYEHEAAELPAKTSKTIRKLSQLGAECDRTRRRGFATDDEEHEEGVRCAAAPIRDATGRTVAAIGISAPASRLPKQRLASFAQSALDAAHEVSAALGYTSLEP